MRCNFFSGRGLSGSEVATEHDLYKTIGNIDVCIEFELLKVKVPIDFLGTVGFSPPREGRYLVLLWPTNPIQKIAQVRGCAQAPPRISIKIFSICGLTNPALAHRLSFVGAVGGGGDMRTPLVSPMQTTLMQIIEGGEPYQRVRVILYRTRCDR
jgi:hypothetical protein